MDKEKWRSRFDLIMGSFNGAELCELVGLYILHILGEKYGKHKIGLMMEMD